MYDDEYTVHYTVHTILERINLIHFSSFSVNVQLSFNNISIQFPLILGLPAPGDPGLSGPRALGLWGAVGSRALGLSGF